MVVLCKIVLQSSFFPRRAALCFSVVLVCWKHAATETWKHSNRRHFGWNALNRQFTDNLQPTLWLNVMINFFKFNAQHFLCGWHIFINAPVHRWRGGNFPVSQSFLLFFYQETRWRLCPECVLLFLHSFSQALTMAPSLRAPRNPLSRPSLSLLLQPFPLPNFGQRALSKSRAPRCVVNIYQSGWELLQN